MKTYLCHTHEEALKHTANALRSVRRGESLKTPKHLLEPSDERETNHRKMKKILRSCCKFKTSLAHKVDPPK